MLIKSISMENFQCYSGNFEENTFEFQKGLNVIIGDNGSGKSKLYDAFYWVLYDKVFNSSVRDFQPTSYVALNLISDRAKAECQIGETVYARVKLILQESRKDDMYTLQRSFGITKKVHSEDLNSKENWIFSSSSSTRIERKDVLNFKPMTESGAFNRISNRLLPTDMKPYLWFQGEQVDSLIDFKNKDSLVEAINVLSDITQYDFLIEIAEKVYVQANKAYKMELSRNSKSQKDTEQLQIEHDNIERAIDKDQLDLKQVQDQLEIATVRRDELYGKFEDAQELTKLKGELDKSENDCKRLKNRINSSRKKFNSNLFNKQWILRNSGEYFDQFEKMIADYEENRNDQKAEYKYEQQREEAKKHRLPEDVPNKRYLQEMLDEKKCFLCDRNFEVGDHASNYLNDILEKTKSNRVRFTDFLNNDLKRYYKTLENNAHYLHKNIIPNIDQSIGDEILAISDMESKLSCAVEEYKKLDDQFKHLQATSKIDFVDSKNIISNLEMTDSSESHFKQQEFQLTSRLESNRIKLKEISDKLQEAIGDNFDNNVIEKKDILEAFRNLSISTRDLVYKEQISRIEEEANKHFHKMTEKNSAVRGRIVLEKRGDSYMPKNIDDSGQELTSINDSNIILIKLATIMAIVTAKGGGSLHPMISDAPTSKFSDNYTIGFCNTISEVFDQSIIISYDFFHNKKLRTRLFEEISNIGAVYIIEPSVAETNRMNRSELSTISNRLN